MRRLSPLCKERVSETSLPCWSGSQMEHGTFLGPPRHKKGKEGMRIGMMNIK